MSDVKEIGVIGQKYEDRISGKTGVLESRDDKCKTLMMTDEEGKGFSVSYSSFRSKWRKAKSDEIISESVTEEIATEPVISDITAVEPSKIIDNAQMIIGEDNHTCMIWRDGHKSEHCILVIEGTKMFITVTNEMLVYFKPEDFGAEYVDSSSFANNYEIEAKELQTFTNAVIDAINRR